MELVTIARSKQTEESEPPVRARWLNATVLGIGLASFCSDIGHEMATTAMPAVLASLGASSAVLGLIEGVADGLSSFAKLYSGSYSDSLARRKPLAVVGYFLTASGMASFAIARAWWHVLFGRVVGWIGRGARTPVRNVLLTEATTPETYGRAFGLERAMDSAGAVVGPVLALVIAATAGTRAVFLWTLIPGILAALIVAFVVREKPHAPAPRAPILTGIRSLPRAFKRYLIGVGIAGLGDYSNALLLLWAASAWAPIYGIARAGTMAMGFYVGYNVFYTASCFLSGRLADRFAKHMVLAVGYSLAIIPAAVLLLPGASLAKFAVVFAVSGIYMGVWETLEATTAATLLRSTERGIGFGALAVVNGVGDLISSAGIGVLWLWSPPVAMGLVAAASVIGSVVIATSGKKKAVVEGGSINEQ